MPIAIGLIPPPFLPMGISLAPKKKGLRLSEIKEVSTAILLHSLQIALIASEFSSLITVSGWLIFSF